MKRILTDLAIYPCSTQRQKLPPSIEELRSQNDNRSTSIRDVVTINTSSVPEGVQQLIVSH